MILANLKLVVRIAREFLGRGLPLDDLIGEGNLGLIRAATEYQVRFETRFSTYASYWIKQSIRHALINTTSTIRLPAHMVGRLTRWRRVEQELHRQRGIAPSFDDVALVLGLSESQKLLLAQAPQSLRIAPQCVDTADDNLRLPLESSNRREGAWPTLQHDEEPRILRERMKDLDDRERIIIELRYGLTGNPALTLKEIGRRLGVTREWVRKVEMRAIRKLGRGSRVDLGKRGGDRASSQLAWRSRWTARRKLDENEQVSAVDAGRLPLALARRTVHDEGI